MRFGRISNVTYRETSCGAYVVLNASLVECDDDNDCEVEMNQIIIKDIVLLTKIHLERAIDHHLLSRKETRCQKFDFKSNVEYEIDGDTSVIDVLSIIGEFETRDLRDVLNIYRIATGKVFQNQGLLTHTLNYLKFSPHVDGIIISQFCNHALAIHLGLSEGFEVYDSRHNVIEESTLRSYKKRLETLSKERGRPVHHLNGSSSLKKKSEQRVRLPEYAVWLHPIIHNLITDDDRTYQPSV